MKSNSKSLGKIFKTPLLIAFASALGLLFALLSDGVFDVLSWLLLSVPVYASRGLLKFKSNKNISMNQKTQKAQYESLN